jgi:hypothetical protein
MTLLRMMISGRSSAGTVGWFLMIMWLVVGRIGGHILLKKGMRKHMRVHPSHIQSMTRDYRPALEKTIRTGAAALGLFSVIFITTSKQVVNHSRCRTLAKLCGLLVGTHNFSLAMDFLVDLPN